MMKTLNLLTGSSVAIACLVSPLLFITTGCENERVAIDDVEDAQVEADRKAEDLREAEEAAAERINEKQRELNKIINQEQERVAEERAEARAAQDEAEVLSNQFRSQEARETYLEEQRIALEDAERRIELLDDDVADLEGPELELHDARIDRLNELHAEASAKLDDLEAAEPEVWDVRQRSADGAIARLQTALANDGITADVGRLD